MVVLAMLLQPACLLYTRSVMRGAAAQTARAAATAGPGDEGALESYARRRLAAVPDLNIFHEGGDAGWDVTVRGAGGNEVSVEIVGHARPLPIVGGLAAALGGSDARGIELRASVSERVRPEWLEGDYGDWVGAWDA